MTRSSSAVCTTDRLSPDTETGVPNQATEAEWDTQA